MRSGALNWAARRPAVEPVTQVAGPPGRPRDGGAGALACDGLRLRPSAAEARPRRRSRGEVNPHTPGWGMRPVRDGAAVIRPACSPPERTGLNQAPDGSRASMSSAKTIAPQGVLPYGLWPFNYPQRRPQGPLGKRRAVHRGVDDAGGQLRLVGCAPCRRQSLVWSPREPPTRSPCRASCSACSPSPGSPSSSQ